MKTTVELPDDLMIEVKKAAAERRTTIRELVERGLRRELGGDQGRERPSRPIEWVTVDAGLPPRLDLSDRVAMHEWIASEMPDGGD